MCERQRQRQRDREREGKWRRENEIKGYGIKERT